MDTGQLVVADVVGISTGADLIVAALAQVERLHMAVAVVLVVEDNSVGHLVLVASLNSGPIEHVGDGVQHQVQLEDAVAT